MSFRLFHIAAIGVALVIGTAVVIDRPGEESADKAEAQLAAPESTATPQKEKEAAQRLQNPPIPPSPEPPHTPVAQQSASSPQPVKGQMQARRPAQQLTAEQQRAAMLEYWRRAEDQFSLQWDRLDGTMDPDQRAQLISRMAQYVRMNTLDTIHWAMNLEDSGERRLALEAINKYALSGIGARITADATGYPKIAETTVLSAVGSTGMVESGDYIVGIVNTDGQSVDFRNMPMQQIIQYLRGEPGSDVLLMLEREADNGQAYLFDVPVQRSLLVVQPPY